MLFFSTLVRCGEYRSQTGIQRKLNFVSVRTIKEGSSFRGEATVRESFLNSSDGSSEVDPPEYLRGVTVFEIGLSLAR